MTIAACASIGLFIVGGAIVLTRIKAIPARCAQDHTGTVFRPRPLRGCLLVSVTLLAVASGLFVFDRSTASIDFPSISERQFGKIVALFVISLVALVTLLRGLGRDCGRLTLSPTGLILIDYHGKPVSVEWSDIIEIDDQAPKGRTFQPIVIKTRTRSPMVIQSLSYCDHGAALYWLIRHYWRTPTDRTELANGSALERLRQQNFAMN